jgi:hypothetical protein
MIEIDDELLRCRDFSSDFFETSLDSFIENLEGEADFLKHSVDLV